MLPIGVSILLMVTTYTVAEKYKIHETLETWEEANNSCTLFTPELSSFNEPIVLNVTQPITEKIWTGYVKLYHDFAYIGCINVDNSKHVNSFECVPDPGICFKKCGGNKIFGIGDTGGNIWMCYCFENRPDIRYANEPRCTTNCPGTNIPCGKAWCIAGPCYNFISVYLEVGFSSSDSHLCRSYDPVKSKYLWETCTENCCYTLCIDVNGDFQVGTFDAFQWHQAVKYCFTHDWYPLYNVTKPLTLRNRNHPDKHLWTAMFNSLVIHRASDAVYTTGSYIEYGYLEYSGNQEDVQFYLRFTNNVSTLGVSLCTGVSTASTPTISSTLTHTAAVTDTLEYTISGTEPLVSTKPNTISSSTSTHTADATDNLDKSTNTASISAKTPHPSLLVGSNVGTAIGVLTLCLLVGAIVLHLKRKRTRTPTESEVVNATRPTTNTHSGSTTTRRTVSADSQVSGRQQAEYEDLTSVRDASPYDAIDRSSERHVYMTMCPDYVNQSSNDYLTTNASKH